MRLTVPRKPRRLLVCNCSICRRYGALWTYYRPDEVRVSGRRWLSSYVWGDRTLRNMRCRRCGCITHWEPTKGSPARHMGVNARNMDPGLLKGVRLRHFDGADTWKYLD